MNMKILITCPPMIKQIDRYDDIFKKYNLSYFCPNFTQVMSEEELMNILPNYDGWIIGDDPATRQVFEAGKQGKLKAAIKWGVGVDNVDFKACHDLNIPITNTPGMFGNEVADVAIGYMLGLARDLYFIDSSVKEGIWEKPTGVSLYGKKVCVIGFGDIGMNIVKRLVPFDMNICISDPNFIDINNKLVSKNDTNIFFAKSNNNIKLGSLEECLSDADFVIVSCALNSSTFHILNKNNLAITNKDLRLINVSRGPVVDENAVLELLDSGHIHGVAFDVFEVEPLSMNNKLREYKKNIFGSHNSSNTIEAVDKTSKKAIDELVKFLNI